jgi:anti-sigma-K factor RskA
VSGTERVLTCDEVRELAGGFVLDALEVDEADAVRAHLAGCADPHAEIADLASGLPALWETVPIVEPPAALRSRLLAAAAADLPPSQERPANPERTAAPTTDPTNVRPFVRPLRRRMTLGWVAGLAAVLAIALLGAWNVVLQGQVGTLRTDQDSVAAVIHAGGIAGSVTAMLTAPQASGPYGPTGLAAVTRTGTLVLAMRDLRPTTGAQVYQAWVILPGSAPVPTGSFRVGDAGVGSIPSASTPVRPGAVVAITLEPGPGATTPTLPILASGTTATPVY